MDKEIEDKVNAKLRQKNREICSRIRLIAYVKDIKQKEIAEMLGKKPSEISKWLSGDHNLTLKSLIMLEVALEEDIIIAPKFDYSKYRKDS